MQGQVYLPFVHRISPVLLSLCSYSLPSLLMSVQFQLENPQHRNMYHTSMFCRLKMSDLEFVKCFSNIGYTYMMLADVCKFKLAILLTTSLVVLVNLFDPFNFFSSKFTN